MNKVEEIAQNLSNFNCKQRLNQKGKITLPKNKCNTAHFRQVLEDVAKNAITQGVKK